MRMPLKFSSLLVAAACLPAHAIAPEPASIDRVVGVACNAFVEQMQGSALMTHITSARALDGRTICACAQSRTRADPRLARFHRPADGAPDTSGAPADDDTALAYVKGRVLQSVLACFNADLDAALQASDGAGPRSAQPGSTLPTGRWEGQLHWHSSHPVEGRDSGVSEFAFVNCGEPVIYVKENGRYGRGKGSPRSISHLTSHLLYEVMQGRGDDPAWVETHSWAFVELPPNELRVSWSRSVNNRLQAADDPERSFARVGMGTFRKVAETCDVPGWPAKPVGSR